MKDFHCHLLPGVDDGAGTLADTEKMLQSAAAAGIDIIAATSHFSPECESRYADALTAASELAARYGIRLLPGMEYDLTDVADSSGKKLRTLGETGYLLVDMNCDYIVHSMVNLFFELKLAGFKIIFAHPERMLSAKELDKLLKLLADNDILVQIDCGSITGRYGERARHNAFAVLDRGACHFLWSDAHNEEQFEQNICRIPIEKRYGSGVFQLLTEENPAALLTGGEILPAPGRKTWLDYLRRADGTFPLSRFWRRWLSPRES